MNFQMQDQPGMCLDNSGARRVSVHFQWYLGGSKHVKYASIGDIICRVGQGSHPSRWSCEKRGGRVKAVVGLSTQTKGSFVRGRCQQPSFRTLGQKTPPSQF